MGLVVFKIDHLSSLQDQAGSNLFSNHAFLVPGGQKISLKYDDFQQLQESVLKKADSTELAKAVYEYDFAQNIKKIQKGEGTFNYSYDNLYRLTSTDSPEGYAANDENFDYDGVGNRIARTANGVSETQSYNQKNQLQTIDSGDSTQDATYTYNANGHTKTQTKNGVETEYIYNHEERLIAVKRGGVTIAEYAYNPHGQRIKKMVSGVTTWYFYTGNGLAAEYSDSGSLIKEYQFHPQSTWMTDPLFQRTAAGELYYYHNDHLGTPQQLLDESGNIVWNAQYSAFGKAYVTVNTVENNLRFPGQYFDAETGLHQNFMRDYDAETGRYLQEDPLGLESNPNYYFYSYQNPLIFIDPTGEMGLPGAAIGALLDIAIQLAANGGRIECIKWDVVAIAALAGAVNPYGIGSAASIVMKGERMAARAQGLKNGSRAAKRTAQRAAKNHANGAKEAASWVAVEGTAEGIGNLIPDDKHWRLPKDDECEPCK